MKMTEEIDLGPVLGQESATILQGCDPSYDNRESLTRRLGTLGGELIVETLKKLESGQAKETKQPAESPTPYTHRLTKDLGRVDWKKITGGNRKIYQSGHSLAGGRHQRKIQDS